MPHKEKYWLKWMTINNPRFFEWHPEQAFISLLTCYPLQPSPLPKHVAFYITTLLITEKKVYWTQKTLLSLLAKKTEKKVLHQAQWANFLILNIFWYVSAIVTMKKISNAFIMHTVLINLFFVYYNCKNLEKFPELIMISPSIYSFVSN